MQHSEVRRHIIQRIAERLAALDLGDPLFVQRQSDGMDRYGDTNSLERDWDGKREVVEELVDAMNLICMRAERYGVATPELGLLAAVYKMMVDEDRPLLVYVACPYSDNPERNVQIAKCMGFDIVRLGHVPLLPTVMYYEMEKSDLEYETFLEIGLTLLSLCDTMLCTAPSPGVGIEWVFARRIGKPIIYNVSELPCRTWQYPLVGTIRPLSNCSPKG